MQLHGGTNLAVFDPETYPKLLEQLLAMGMHKYSLKNDHSPTPSPGGMCKSHSPLP